MDHNPLVAWLPLAASKVCVCLSVCLSVSLSARLGGGVIEVIRIRGLGGVGGGVGGLGWFKSFLCDLAVCLRIGTGISGHSESLRPRQWEFGHMIA